MPKRLLDRTMNGTSHFVCKEPTSGSPWKMPKYRVYGRIALGENVTVYDGSDVYRGEAVYIHPRGRFFQIQANGEPWRTSFAFPPTKGDG